MKLQNYLCVVMNGGCVSAGERVISAPSLPEAIYEFIKNEPSILECSIFEKAKTEAERKEVIELSIQTGIDGEYGAVSMGNFIIDGLSCWVFDDDVYDTLYIFSLDEFKKAFKYYGGVK